MDELLRKTPAEYRGFRPSDEDFGVHFNALSKEQKLEYLRYLERDSGRFGAKLFLLAGGFLGCLLGYFLVLENAAVVFCR